MKMRMSLAVLAGAGAGGYLFLQEREVSQHARRLLSDGKSVTAEVISASVRQQRTWDFSTAHLAEVDYRFIADGGRVTGGRDRIALAALDAMTDPGDPSSLRGDAAVEIYYMVGDPLDSGIRSNLTKQQEPNLLVPSIAFLLAGLGMFGLIGRVVSRFGRDSVELVKG